MEICEVKKEGLKRYYKVRIEANNISSKNSNKIDEIQKVAKLPGFRPGMVPASYLEKRFGGSVTQETIDELVREASLKLIKDEDLHMAAQPKIDVKEYKEGSDLNYEFECEVLPQIEDLDYSKVKLVNYIVKVPESEIDKQIELRLSSLKTFQEVDNKDKDVEVKKGMGVKIDYEGYIDGEKFEGGSSTDYQLEIGSNTFIDNFEDQLIGLKVGNHKKVKVSFPKEYHKKEFQGKSAIFEVDIKGILEVVKQELNDEFIAKQGVKDIAEYKQKTRTEIETFYNKQAKEQFKKELFDYIEDKINIELPSSMVESEFKIILDQYLNENNYKNEEEAEEKDAKQLKKRKEYLGIAKRRVKVGILLSEIGKKNNIEVNDNEVMQALQAQMAGYPGDQADLLAYYQKNPQAMEYIRGPLLEDKVVDHIHSKITLKDKELTIGQFQKIYN